MDVLGKHIDLKNKGWQWGLSLCITSVLFATTYATSEIIFATNDDIRIMYALAGYNLGEPYPYHPFINLFLGKIIALLYSCVPMLPWYALSHIFCLFASMVIIGKCIIGNSARRGNGLFIPIALFAFLYYSSVIYTVVCMQFSTTPALLGSAAVALILSIDLKKDSDRSIYGDLVLSIVLMTVCFLFRSFTWYCLICFYVLAVVFLCLQVRFIHKNVSKKWWLVLAACVLMAVASVLTVRYISLQQKQVEEVNVEYDRYNTYRADFQDYNKCLTYDEAPELYQELGWSKNTYRATKNFLLFFDENLNADSLQRITETYDSVAVKRNLDDTIATAKAVLVNNRTAKSALSSVVLLALLCLLVGFARKKRGSVLLCVCCCFGGFLLMYLLLAYRGRLPLRIFMTISIPCSVFLATMLTRTLKVRFYWNTLRRTVAIVSLGCMLLISCYLMHAIYMTDECVSTQTTTTATMEQSQAFEEYAIDHKESVFVYDFTVATIQRDPFVVYPEEKPVNCIISGGSYTFSTIYYKQLSINGLESLYWQDFLEDNVYYVSANVKYVNMMKANIEETVGKDVSYQVIESFGKDGISIYKFSLT